MKRTLVTTVAILGLAGTLALTAVSAQGNGQGRGAGQGRGNRAGTCIGLNNGTGTPGGWWARVTPNTPQQAEFVAQLRDIHNRIRTLNIEIATLRNQNGSAAAIAQKQQQVNGLRQELQRLTTANQALLREMGVPNGAGVCDGTGPKGQGQGYGKGQGKGAGMGKGAGKGQGRNSNCPFVGQVQQGTGR